jgi:uncharacterized coiled-coil DUF342 family protein
MTDSSDRLRAPLSPSDMMTMLRDVLHGVNKTSEVVGELRADMRAVAQRLDDHRDARSKVDEEIKEKHDDFEDRLRTLEGDRVVKQDLVEIKSDLKALDRWKMWLIGAGAGAGALAAVLLKIVLK